MLATRWNPWDDLYEVQRDMTDMIRRTFGSWPAPQALRTGGLAWAPAVDVFSREGDLVVRAELPGINPERDVEISMQDGLLSLRGERRQESTTNGENYYRTETTYGTFHRTVPLPEGVQAEKIQATYENGILEVVV